MKTIAKLGTIAGFAVVMLSLIGCDQPIQVDSLPSGSENYDFTGKTLAFTEPEAVIYRVDATETGNDDPTVTEIVLSETTYTLTFNADKTFAYSEVTTWTSAADTDYATPVANIEYRYPTFDGIAWTSNTTGFAGQTDQSVTVTGTWNSYDYRYYEDDSQSLFYFFDIAGYTETSYEGDGYGNGSTATYGTADADSETVTVTSSGDYEEVYRYDNMGTDSSGNTVMRMYFNTGNFEGGLYVIQP